MHWLFRYNKSLLSIQNCIIYTEGRRTREQDT